MTAVVSQETLICKHDPDDASRLLVLLSLDGISMNIDSGNLMNLTTTSLTIEGVSYIPVRSTINIALAPGGVAITTTVVVIPKTLRT